MVQEGLGFQEIQEGLIVLLLQGSLVIQANQYLPQNLSYQGSLGIQADQVHPLGQEDLEDQCLKHQDHLFLLSVQVVLGSQVVQELLEYQETPLFPEGLENPYHLYFL